MSIISLKKDPITNQFFCFVLISISGKGESFLIIPQRLTQYFFPACLSISSMDHALLKTFQRYILFYIMTYFSHYNRIESGVVMRSI